MKCSKGIAGTKEVPEGIFSNFLLPGNVFLPITCCIKTDISYENRTLTVKCHARSFTYESGKDHRLYAQDCRRGCGWGLLPVFTALLVSASLKRRM